MSSFRTSKATNCPDSQCGLNICARLILKKTYRNTPVGSATSFSRTISYILTTANSLTSGCHAQNAIRCSLEPKAKLEWQAGQYEHPNIWDHILQFRPSGIRIKPGTYFPALVAITQTSIIGCRKRELTLRECARLQSFPDTFQPDVVEAQAYKQFGNAVNVEVVKLFAKYLFGDKATIKKYAKPSDGAGIAGTVDFLKLLEQYPDKIVENKPISTSAACRVIYPKENVITPKKVVPIIEDLEGLDPTKNLLVSLVKADNIEQYLDQTAKIYYTGKKFPSTVALNKLYYFMPYFLKQGVKDLYYIKIARVGTRKEGQPDNDPNDLRLVFEIEFVKELFPEYKKVHLDIWKTFKDTTLADMLAK